MFATTELTGGGPAPDVVLYGDSHATYPEVSGGRTPADVGSVGNALDETTASCLVLERTPDGTRPDPFGLGVLRGPYDAEAAARMVR